MNKICIILLFIALNLLVTNTPAKANNDNSNQQKPPSGMEIITVGDGQQLILPKGTKMRKIGAQLIIEDNAEYVSERIWDLEKRIKRLESANEELKKQIQELKNPAP
ncbi:MAG: hypothetical protein PHP73_07175 [Candidatus Omnitrophica bacterium]|nr:hypothetical protein [Candidatus Omnitrophota bacterium]MDD5477064.1 hypothetical protein [Candidatus Omnitrophota bacterium]